MGAGRARWGWSGTEGIDIMVPLLLSLTWDLMRGFDGVFGCLLLPMCGDNPPEAGIWCTACFDTSWRLGLRTDTIRQFLLPLRLIQFVFCAVTLTITVHGRFRALLLPRSHTQTDNSKMCCDGILA